MVSPHSNNLIMLDNETMPLDWSFATDLLPDITGIASSTGTLIPFQDSIGPVHYEASDLCPLATSLAVDQLSVPNFCVPWYHVAEENYPTYNMNNSVVPSNDYLYPVYCEPVPFNPVLNLSDNMYTDVNVKNEAAIPQGVCFNETNLNCYENMNEEGVMIEKRETGRARLTHLGYDEIKRYFYMPITQAAKEMNVGLTILKKRCRELGIPRWPHRKMKSLKSLICNVQELEKSSTVEGKINELEILRRLMEENPEMQLTDETKKLRQACFKASYKRRRGRPTYHYRLRLQSPCQKF